MNGKLEGDDVKVCGSKRITERAFMVNIYVLIYEDVLLEENFKLYYDSVSASIFILLLFHLIQP